MTIEEFKSSLAEASPLEKTPELLKAMWHDARGDWSAAHAIAQDVDTPEGAWVHAYLHRKEGDLSNASYWYHLARRKKHEGSLQEEWREIVVDLLARR
jgi:hypothetical protein